MSPRAGILWLALGLAACGGSDAPGPRVVDGDERYRVTLDARSPVSPDASGELVLKIDTAEHWHVADEAPARLVLSADDLEFAPAELGRDDVRNRHDSGFEFATAIRAEREGRRVAQAELTFGVCEEQVLMCEVVHAQLELPVDVRFQP